MSYYDGFAPVYTFHLSVEREDRTLLDAVITAAGSADMADINRAKRSIVRLLNENTPKLEPVPIPAPELDPEPGPVADSPSATEEPETEDSPGQEPEPPAPPEPEEPDRPAGLKGMVKLVCPVCGKEFHKFLSDFHESITCNCGNKIDLTDPTMARFSYDCPKCGAFRYGWTNMESPEIDDSCACGEIVHLEWDKRIKKYKAQKPDGGKGR